MPGVEGLEPEYVFFLEFITYGVDGRYLGTLNGAPR